MKKNSIVMSALFLLGLIFAGIIINSGPRESPANTATSYATPVPPVAASTPQFVQDKHFTIPPESYEALRHYIVMNGFDVGHNDTQVTLFDSAKNRHAMVLMREQDMEDPNPRETQISVWGNTKDVPKDKTVFYYIIQPDGVVYFGGDTDEPTLKLLLAEIVDKTRA